MELSDDRGELEVGWKERGVLEVITMLARRPSVVYSRSPCSKQDTGETRALAYMNCSLGVNTGRRQGKFISKPIVWKEFS